MDPEVEINTRPFSGFIKDLVLSGTKDIALGTYCDWVASKVKAPKPPTASRIAWARCSSFRIVTRRSALET